MLEQAGLVAAARREAFAVHPAAQVRYGTRKEAKHLKIQNLLGFL